MKTIEHARTVLQCELEIWFKRQTCNPYTKYYLYYLPASPCHDSGLSICAEKPANPDVKLASPDEVNGFKTIQWNYNKFSNILNCLPILD